MKRANLAAVIFVALVVAAGGLAYVTLGTRSTCQPNQAKETSTGQLAKTSFGAVTEYALPGPNPWANAVTVAPDGSVWIGEQGLPGVAQFNPTSGSLVEYQWPCYPSSKIGPVSSIWGIATWNGKVWATDGDANRLVGLSPSTGAVTYVNTTTAAYPYLLSPAPDGSLWFTSLTSPAKLGRLATDMSLTVYRVSGLGKEYTIQTQFVNSTFAYMVALNPLSATGEGRLYSFDPRTDNGTITAHPVGGNFSLYSPDSLSVSEGKVWVAQHYPSNVAVYDSSAGSWTIFPTSTVGYTSTTLPYFVDASGNGVWFNEHYHNAIAYLDPYAGTMTEYSESNPPIVNASQIQNDLTIAAAQGGLWFTSTSANYIGFVDGGFSPAFSIGVAGSNQLSLAPGGSKTMQFDVSGTWNSSLSVKFSDSENFTSVPSQVTLRASSGSLRPMAGTANLTVSISAGQDIRPGRYTLDVTVTDGVISQTAFVFLTVS
jgi:streptogramin lyase